MRIENWKPTLKDLQGVFRLGGIEVKAWMSLSRDCPARMSDLLRISSKQVQFRRVSANIEERICSWKEADLRVLK